MKQLEKAVSGKEPRYVLRALRALPSTSRRLNPNVLHKAIHGFFTSNSAVRDFLLGFLEEVRGRGAWGCRGPRPRCLGAHGTQRGSLQPRVGWPCGDRLTWGRGVGAVGGQQQGMGGGDRGRSPAHAFPPQPMDMEAELQFRPRTGKAASAPLLPEVETYLQLLLVIYLMNSKRYPEVRFPEPCLNLSPSQGAAGPASRSPGGFGSAWRQPLGPAALTRGGPAALSDFPLLPGGVSSAPFPSCRLRRCLTT